MLSFICPECRSIHVVNDKPAYHEPQADCLGNHPFHEMLSRVIGLELAEDPSIEMVEKTNIVGMAWRASARHFLDEAARKLSDPAATVDQKDMTVFTMGNAKYHYHATRHAAYQKALREYLETRGPSHTLYDDMDRICARCQRVGTAYEFLLITLPA